MNSISSPLTAELKAALEWWQIAGVDFDFSDEANDWLAGQDAQADSTVSGQTTNPDTSLVGQTAQKASSTRQISRIDLLGDAPPPDLNTFRRFWLEAEGLDTIGPRGRVPSRGPENAELMVLVIDPEERDSERLLDGPQGKFLNRIVAAMGLNEDDVYIASALPRHTPMADAASLAAGGMDAVTAHHVKLAAPKRIIAFGSNVPPFLGHASTKDVSSLREINQGSRNVPLLVSEGLDSLMSMPRLKARFWRRWIEWSADQQG